MPIGTEWSRGILFYLRQLLSHTFALEIEPLFG